MQEVPRVTLKCLYCVYSISFNVSQTVVVETEVSLWRLLALFDTLCGLEIFENVAYTMSAITEIDKWVEWEDS